MNTYAGTVDFELFWPDLEAALDCSNRPKGGRWPFDPVMMFKVLVIHGHNNFSGDRAEFLINDRLRFMRFLGLGLSNKVPDTKVIWALRERLTKASAIETRCVSALMWLSARPVTSPCWGKLSTVP